MTAPQLGHVEIKFARPQFGLRVSRQQSIKRQFSTQWSEWQGFEWHNRQSQLQVEQPIDWSKFQMTRPVHCIKGLRSAW